MVVRNIPVVISNYRILRYVFQSNIYKKKSSLKKYGNKMSDRITLVEKLEKLVIQSPTMEQILSSVNLSQSLDDQKQPSGGVPTKMCSENMQQTYRRTPMFCNIIKMTLRHGSSPVNLLYIFRTPYRRNTSKWLFLGDADEELLLSKP